MVVPQGLRMTKYIKQFDEVDSIRQKVLWRIIESVSVSIDADDSEEAEATIDMDMAKLEFLNEIAANVINAIEENGVTDGS